MAEHNDSKQRCVLLHDAECRLFCENVNL